ncbi:hypothetical protein [Pseudomonas orientalis]|uniref:hypothetical protein n=1 Tax=Pseudomonas orientalis TaxID=76758 RepID=UPI001F5C8EF6|nr:hypothetical protein [Pseudomonas orientalis]
MQSSSAQTPSATGELIASFRHGKGFLIFSLIFGVALLGLAVFVLYLGTILPAGSSGPVVGQTSRGLSFSFSSPQTLIYFTSALLTVLALGVFAGYACTKNCARRVTTCMNTASSASSTTSTTTLPLPTSKTCTCLVPGKP